jgi:hypothetical protein
VSFSGGYIIYIHQKDFRQASSKVLKNDEYKIFLANIASIFIKTIFGVIFAGICGECEVLTHRERCAQSPKFSFLPTPKQQTSPKISTPQKATKVTIYSIIIR